MGTRSMGKGELEIKLTPIDGETVTRLYLDGELLGIFQRVELRSEEQDGKRVTIVEIDQVVYSRQALIKARVLQRIPYVRFKPLFMDHEGKLTENPLDAWFFEDHLYRVESDNRYCERIYVYEAQAEP